MSHNCLSNEEFELEGLVNDISISGSSGSLSAVEDSRIVWPSRCRFCFFMEKRDTTTIAFLAYPLEELTRGAIERHSAGKRGGALYHVVPPYTEMPRDGVWQA